MSRKQSSGIGRGRRKSGGGSAKMSPEDRSYLRSLQEDVERENQRIPSFVREDMTKEEIQEAIIGEIHRTGEQAGGVFPIEIDGRLGAPKDKHFAPLIRSMNATQLKGYLMAGHREVENFFISRAEKLTGSYSTKDLRRFVTDELQEKIYRGGRKEYVTTIGLALLHRFNPRGITGIGIRQTLNVPTYRLERAAVEIKQAIDRRDIYRRRIADIQAKYK